MDAKAGVAVSRENDASTLSTSLILNGWNTLPFGFLHGSIKITIMPLKREVMSAEIKALNTISSPLEEDVSRMFLLVIIKEKPKFLG